MKRLLNIRLVVAVLAVACLMTVLLIVAPTKSNTPGSGEYDPWLDVNDDGKIDILDISRVAKAFRTQGQNISKASLTYDSGWLDLRNETGEYYTVTHNLNDTELQVDVRENIAGWNQTYGGTGSDVAWTLVQTGDGGYAIAGRTASFGAGSDDFWLVKTDAAGTVQWNQTYGGTYLDEAAALVQTTDGGYALAGTTTSFGVGGADAWLVKTDANGTMQWNKTYGGTLDDVANAIVQTKDGGYALAAWTGSFGAGDWDFWLVKTDVNGIVQWNNTYGGTSRDKTAALVQTTDGGYALTGETLSFGAGNWDSWLVKIDSAGNAQWNKTYGGAGVDEAYALVQTRDGGYTLAGTTTSSGAGSWDFWLVKTDASGTMQWNKTYGGANIDDAYALVQTSDGGYALTGRTRSFNAGMIDAWLVKTDASGNMQWNKTYGETLDIWAYALVQTTDGGYALAGYRSSLAADFWLVKTDIESGLAWVDLSANTVTLYRGATDTSWNYVRVRLWKPR
jgi:hypothetical protein